MNIRVYKISLKNKKEVLEARQKKNFNQLGQKSMSSITYKSYSSEKKKVNSLSRKIFEFLKIKQSKECLVVSVPSSNSLLQLKQQLNKLFGGSRAKLRKHLWECLGRKSDHWFFKSKYIFGEKPKVIITCHKMLGFRGDSSFYNKFLLDLLLLKKRMKIKLKLTILNEEAFFKNCNWKLRMDIPVKNYQKFIKNTDNSTFKQIFYQVISRSNGVKLERPTFKKREETEKFQTLKETPISELREYDKARKARIKWQNIKLKQKSFFYHGIEESDSCWYANNFRFSVRKNKLFNLESLLKTPILIDGSNLKHLDSSKFLTKRLLNSVNAKLCYPSTITEEEILTSWWNETPYLNQTRSLKNKNINEELSWMSGFRLGSLVNLLKLFNNIDFFYEEFTNTHHLLWEWLGETPKILKKPLQNSSQCGRISFYKGFVTSSKLRKVCSKRNVTYFSKKKIKIGGSLKKTSELNLKKNKNNKNWEEFYLSKEKNLNVKNANTLWIDHNVIYDTPIVSEKMLSCLKSFTEYLQNVPFEKFSNFLKKWLKQIRQKSNLVILLNNDWVNLIAWNTTFKKYFSNFEVELIRSLDKSGLPIDLTSQQIYSSLISSNSQRKKIRLYKNDLKHISFKKSQLLLESSDFINIFKKYRNFVFFIEKKSNFTIFYFCNLKTNKTLKIKVTDKTLGKKVSLKVNKFLGNGGILLAHFNQAEEVTILKDSLSLVNANKKFMNWEKKVKVFNKESILFVNLKSMLPCRQNICLERLAFFLNAQSINLSILKHRIKTLKQVFLELFCEKNLMKYGVYLDFLLKKFKIQIYFHQALENFILEPEKKWINWVFLANDLNLFSKKEETNISNKKMAAAFWEMARLIKPDTKKVLNNCFQHKYSKKLTLGNSTLQLSINGISSVKQVNHVLNNNSDYFIWSVEVSNLYLGVLNKIGINSMPNVKIATILNELEWEFEHRKITNDKIGSSAFKSMLQSLRHWVGKSSTFPLIKTVQTNFIWIKQFFMCLLLEYCAKNKISFYNVKDNTFLIKAKNENFIEKLVNWGETWNVKLNVIKLNLAYFKKDIELKYTVLNKLEVKNLDSLQEVNFNSRFKFNLPLAYLNLLQNKKFYAHKVSLSQIHHFTFFVSSDRNAVYYVKMNDQIYKMNYLRYAIGNNSNIILYKKINNKLIIIHKSIILLNSFNKFEPKNLNFKFYCDFFNGKFKSKTKFLNIKKSMPLDSLTISDLSVFKKIFSQFKNNIKIITTASSKKVLFKNLNNLKNIQNLKRLVLYARSNLYILISFNKSTLIPKNVRDWLLKYQKDLLICYHDRNCKKQKEAFIINHLKFKLIFEVNQTNLNILKNVQEKLLNYCVEVHFSGNYPIYGRHEKQNSTYKLISNSKKLPVLPKSFLELWSFKETKVIEETVLINDVDKTKLQDCFKILETKFSLSYKKSFFVSDSMVLHGACINKDKSENSKNSKDFFIKYNPEKNTLTASCAHDNCVAEKSIFVTKHIQDLEQPRKKDYFDVHTHPGIESKEYPISSAEYAHIKAEDKDEKEQVPFTEEYEPEYKWNNITEQYETDYSWDQNNSEINHSSKDQQKDLIQVYMKSMGLENDSPPVKVFSCIDPFPFEEWDVDTKKQPECSSSEKPKVEQTEAERQKEIDDYIESRFPGWV